MEQVKCLIVLTEDRSISFLIDYRRGLFIIYNLFQLFTQFFAIFQIDIKEKIDQACRTAEEFTKLYYDSVDKKRYVSFCLNKLYLKH